MTLQDNVTILDPFTHTQQERDKVVVFDFFGEKPIEKREKIRIEESFCTLVAVGGDFLEKKALIKVQKKIDEIRIKFRILILILKLTHNQLLLPIHMIFNKF